METKRFFQFAILINVLVSYFPILWKLILWNNGHCKYIYSYCAGIDFRRQNLTSTDVRFRRLNLIPALYGLSIANRWTLWKNMFRLCFCIFFSGNSSKIIREKIYIYIYLLITQTMDIFKRTVHWPLKYTCIIGLDPTFYQYINIIIIIIIIFIEGIYIAPYLNWF